VIGLLPLGRHDKVIGRAQPSSMFSQPLSKATFLRKDTNFPEKTASKLTTTLNTLSRLAQERGDPSLDVDMFHNVNQRSNNDDDPVEPHLIPEEAIIRSLNQLRGDTFYLLVYIRAKTD